MFLKRSPLVAVLMLGGSLVALGAGGAARADAIAAEPATLDKPVAQAPAAQIVVPQVVAPRGPDTQSLAALRYYTAQHDQTRVAAEIRLLRAKFPGWEPPADLGAEKADDAEQPLWDLFAKHDLAGLKTAVAERRRQVPGWQPSVDLSAKLALAEAYEALIQASDRKDYGTVVDLAANNDGLITCANVDAIWRTAEALAQTNDEPRAIEAYRYVLANCTVPQERLATVQKAALLIKSREAVDGLLRMGTARPDGTSEFATVETDDLRQRIGDAAAGRTATQPSPADLDQLAVRARMADGGKDAELLGWYALSRKDPGAAATWFKTAVQSAPNAKAAEGLVLALSQSKSPEAVMLAMTYAGLGPQNRKLMVDVVVASLNGGKTPLSAGQLTMLGAAIDEEKSADAAQTLGWSRFKAKDVRQAEGWFRKSMAWEPNQAAAVGLMLAAKRLKHGADYAAVVTHYKASYPRVAELDNVLKVSERPRPTAATPQPKRAVVQVAGNGGAWDHDAATIVKAYEGGQVDKALALMDSRKATRAEPKGLTLVRGWALYKKGDLEGARKAFTAVGNGGANDEAAKGLRQIELSYTNPRYR